MSTMIREWRIVQGMTANGAIVALAAAWADAYEKPTSLLVDTQMVGDDRLTTYVYECRSLTRAAEIVLGTKFGDGWLTRVRWA